MTRDAVASIVRMGAKDSALIGAAGEHLVLSRLLTRGLLAAQAPRGTRKVDILVNFLDRGEPCLIQVKASSKGRNGWHMQEKHEHVRDRDVYYCFVDFEFEHPTVHVIPARVVAETLERDHQIWLATPGKMGQPHNDTKMRRLRHNCFGAEEDWMDQYLEAWDLIAPQP